MIKHDAMVNYLKEKKKLILIILLIILLACAVYLFFGTDGSSDASADYESIYSETELKLASLLSNMDGVGDVKVYVAETEDIVSGVIIVCGGADNILVRNNVLNAVSTALNINKNLIAIYSM